MFKVLRTFGLIKKISTNSFIKPEVRKTLNIVENVERKRN